MGWYTAPALVTLRNAMNRKWPDRDTGADGFIGNDEHKAQGLGSQHNPRAVVNGVAIERLDYANGVVLAGDYDTDPVPSRAEAWDLARAIVTVRGVMFVNYGYRQASGGGDFDRPGVDGFDHIHVSLENWALSIDPDWNAILAGPASNATDGASVRAPRRSPGRAPGWLGWNGDPANWPLGPGHYFGPQDGPDVCHGGYYENERPAVAAIQAQLVRLGVAGPTQRAWADGIWEQPTSDAVLAWQGAAALPLSGRIGSGDWYRLFALNRQGPAPVRRGPARAPTTPGDTAGPQPSWPDGFGDADCLGLISDPSALVHGGHLDFNRDDIRACIAWLQRRLQDYRWAQTDDPAWADGIFEQATADAVAAWQARQFGRATAHPRQVRVSDWAALAGPIPFNA